MSRLLSLGRYSTMNWTRLILTVSLLANVALIAVFAFRESQRFLWESEAPRWAKYAGAMQAHADFGNGVRRFYRAVPAASVNERAMFTGEHDGTAEVWTHLYFNGQGVDSRRTAEAYVDAYNKRMRGYIADPNSYKLNGLSANQRDD
ncbi:MAG TPA: hypothetical protein VE988_30155 [Gemmataceae bacterium]|nr:hypothetical protein [Gemmataceae bacterium]